MESKLCSFAQSKAMKAAGYKVPVHNWFDLEGKAFVSDNGATHANDRRNHIARPTIADAIRWFRIEKRCFGATLCTATGHFAFSIWVKNDLYQSDNVYSKIYNDWDSCESALLDRLIELTAKQD